MLPSQKQPHIIQGVVGFGSLPRGNILNFKSPTKPNYAETKLHLTLAFTRLTLPLSTAVFLFNVNDSIIR